MRKKSTSGSLTVRAIAGTHVVVLGMSVEADARKGLMGFAIERIDMETGEKRYLPNFLLFKENDKGSANPNHSSERNPIQAFQWCDYTAQPGRKYIFIVTARYGSPKALKSGDAVTLEVITEATDRGKHAIFFNRGAAGWQAYQREFGKQDPDQVPNRAGYRWLSRGLEEALIAFLAQAEGKGWGLRGAFYEFNYVPVLDALWGAKHRGVDVKLVVDEASKNRSAIEVSGIEGSCKPRTKAKIPHNKFIVLLKEGEPVEVWTGSTNVTKGGIFGHSNVGHLVRDKTIAAAYLAYWKELVKDPERKPLQEWTVSANGEPEQRLAENGDALLPPKNSVSVVFSPRRTISALKWYAALMDQAKEGVFVTSPFDVSDQLQEVFENDKDYLRYLLLDHENKRIAPVARSIEKNLNNELAVGSYFGQGNWYQWLKEHLTDFNKSVLFVHTKYMLIDPLGEDPIVITGSANFSEPSTRENDENLLVIRGDTRVADVYVSEFMRLFASFRLRQRAGAEKGKPGPNPSNAGPRPAEKVYLDSRDKWAAPYYKKSSTKEKERLLFSGLNASS
jgi:phosphatidylserine/phosphatidylglycerophosphate/cardiolipin synthase-like enzyme